MGAGTIRSMFGSSKCRGFITREPGARPNRISRTTDPAVPYHEGMKLSFPATLFLSVASASAQQSSMQVPKSSTNEVQNYSLEAKACWHNLCPRRIQGHCDDNRQPKADHGFLFSVHGPILMLVVAFPGPLVTELNIAAPLLARTGKWAEIVTRWRTSRPTASLTRNRIPVY